MVTGMATVGVIDNFITYIAVEVSLWQFHFLRSMIAVPAIVGFGLLAGWTLRPLRLWPVLGRICFCLAPCSSILAVWGSFPFRPWRLAFSRRRYW